MSSTSRRATAISFVGGTRTSRKRSVWCGVREARQPKPPSIAPTLTIAFAPRYAFAGSSSHVGIHSSTASSTSRARRIELRSRLPLAERRVDEVAVDADPQPERAEVAEHDLALGRLAEQAHVRDAAVRDEIARAGRVAAVLRAPARRPAASSRSRRRRPRSARRRAAARRRPAARAPPRRSRRPRPSCSRCRARRAGRPARTPAAGSRGRRGATARGPSTTCRGGR